MSEKINRRHLLVTAISAALLPRAAESAEVMADAIQATAKSLSDGMRDFHGHPVNPRNSGYKYHSELLRHYSDGLKFPSGLSDHAIASRVNKKLIDRIKIFNVSEKEAGQIRTECAAHLSQLATAIEAGEVGAFLYLSADRQFQRIYAVKKNGTGTLQFLESFPMSTSIAEPRVPLPRDVHPTVTNRIPFTPLGLFKIPLDGVRLALLGEVTKIERPDLTRRFFEPIAIDGHTRYFVKDFGKSADDEIVTVTGDTHLLWSPEISGRGIKMHDTTEIDSIGKPASSGCIRTSSIRRFSILTSKNKYPTCVYIYWSKTRNATDRNEGFGGHFGGERK